MPSTLDRLRRLNSLRPAHSAAHELNPTLDDRSSDIETLLPGQEIVNAEGTCFVTTRAYPLRTERGAFPLGALLEHTPSTLARIFPNFNLDRIDSYQNAVFLDTETTGLGTGASVYAFMVGLGTFETLPDTGTPEPVIENTVAASDTQSASMLASPSHFVVRQYFMRNPAEELALLHELRTQLTGKQLSVTFNGRSFDLPLLRSRVRYNRPFVTRTRPDAEMTLNAPLLAEDAPHLDLLMPSRRLWRRRLQSCRLAYLEEAILGHERTEDDVPGYLIPQLYADYVRTGDARQMERVFYHNCEDIVSMVSLAIHLSHAFDRAHDGEPASALQGQDWLSLGLTYERMADWSQAEPAYLRALDNATDRVDLAEIFSRLGRLQKRQGRWQDAANTWQLWLTSVPGNDPSPYVELAKYCEWQLHDYEQAEMWTAWALHNLRQEETEFAWSRTIGELEHRLQRIHRKQNSK